MYTLLDDNFFDDMLVSEFEKVCKFISDSKKENKSEHECKCGGNCESKEIIHCKDCAYFDENKANCNLTSLPVSENDYCSMGNKNKFVETITKEEYETLSMLKALGAEIIEYCYNGAFSAYGSKSSLNFWENGLNINKKLFEKEHKRKIDDLIKLEVIE